MNNSAMLMQTVANRRRSPIHRALRNSPAIDRRAGVVSANNLRAGLT